MDNSLAGIAVKERSKPVQRVRRKRSLRWTMPWLYLLPASCRLDSGSTVPLLQTVRLSFYEWNMLPTSPQVWMGLKNYRLLFQLPDMSQALLNTLIYTIGVIPFALVIPLSDCDCYGQHRQEVAYLYRALVFVPMIMAPVAVSAIWSWLMNPMGGLINKTLMALRPRSGPDSFLF